MQAKSSRIFRIATRKSPLALWQANKVKSLLECSNFKAELVPIVTTGDKMQKGALAQVQLGVHELPNHLNTGKGLFVKEIQEAMLANEADLAVHSMKDLPVHETDSLIVSALLPRARAHDVLILSKNLREAFQKSSAFSKTRGNFSTLSFSEIRESLVQEKEFYSGILGTTSSRRQNLLRNNFGKELNIQILRGNVDTRLSKVRNNEFAAIVLAQAGLERLGLFSDSDMITLPKNLFTPAPAQGVVAVEIRSLDAELQEILSHFSHESTVFAALTERLTLKILGGDCHTAIGIHFDEGILSIFCAHESKCISTEFRPSSLACESLLKIVQNSAGCYNSALDEAVNSMFVLELKDHLRQNEYQTVSSFNPG